MKCDAKINVDTVLSDEQPFCWCRKQPRASRQSQPPLLINKTAWRQQPAHFPGLHSLYPITPLPFPPPPFLFSSKPHPLPLPTWPSAIQLEEPVTGCMDALWLPSTNCSLTLLPLCLFPALFPTSCFRRSLSLVLSASYPSPTASFCFHSGYFSFSSSLHLLCLSPPSLPSLSLQL